MFDWVIDITFPTEYTLRKLLVESVFGREGYEELEYNLGSKRLSLEYYVHEFVNSIEEYNNLLERLAEYPWKKMASTSFGNGVVYLTWNYQKRNGTLSIRIAIETSDLDTAQEMMGCKKLKLVTKESSYSHKTLVCET